MSILNPYRIIPMELDFLRLEKLPLPRTCVDCRHTERIAQRSGAMLYHRQCQCAGIALSAGIYRNTSTHYHGDEPCQKKLETAHGPTEDKIIYCLECYYAETA